MRAPPHLAAISALAQLAKAETHRETRSALRHARELLGDEAPAYEALLGVLVSRNDELDELRRLATSDPLTGVANRRMFLGALQREMARYDRTESSFAVVLLDLDGLKEINDALGHAAGDAAIIALAESCAEQMRFTDLAARLGGDEFAVLLAASDLQGARAFAARLRATVEARQVGGVALRVSVGAAAASAADASPQDILGRGDHALYTDKWTRKRGRASRAA